MGPGELYLCKSVSESLEYKFYISTFYSLISKVLCCTIEIAISVGQKGQIVCNFNLIIHVCDFSS